MSELVLETEALTKTFGGERRLLGGRRPAVHAVRDANLEVRRGETLGLVGESGSGKTTLARMLLGLLEPSAGRIRLVGREVSVGKRRQRREMHRMMQLVFQNPASSLNPRRHVRHILEAPLKVLQQMPRDKRRARVEELMDRVGLRADMLDRYPHEFSGGQAQRIALARALAPDPEIVVLDEPVSALDVSIQAQILNLLRELQQQLNLTYLFISHDLAVIESLCDSVAVMYEGEIVEYGGRDEIFREPKEAYTKRLLSSVPVPGKQTLVDRRESS